MKKSYLIGLFLLLLSSGSGLAQENFKEGKIVYSITYPDMDLDPQQAAMMPSVMTLYIKGENTRTEMKMGMGMSTVVITDAKAKKVTSLIDAMGQKYAMEMNENEIEKEAKSAPEVEVTPTGETKEVAGMKCEVSTVVFTDEKGKKINSEICLSKKFKIPQANWSNPAYKDIDGLMLEYEMAQGDMKMKLTAKSIKQEDVPDEMFNIPADYKPVTREELMNMQMGK